MRINWTTDAEHQIHLCDNKRRAAKLSAERNPYHSFCDDGQSPALIHSHSTFGDWRHLAAPPAPKWTLHDTTRPLACSVLSANKTSTMVTKYNLPDNTHASDSFLMYFVSEWKFWCTSGDWLKDKEPLVFEGQSCDAGDHFTSISRHSVRVVDKFLPLWVRSLPRPLCNYNVINRLLCAYHFAAA